MKAYKNIGFGPRKSKKGFTLIELLIVLVILAILAGVVVMAVGGVFSTSRESAYNTTDEELKNAVAQYASNNMGDLPNGAAINISGVTTAYTINMSLLLVENDGILSSYPDSSSDDNCSGCTGSYTWAIDTYGNVYSACTEAGCSDATGSIGNASAGWTDGYMEPVYP
jgi:prepilin-type N-terminal cleavage/methylation domain-containing protein